MHRACGSAPTSLFRNWCGHRSTEHAPLRRGASTIIALDTWRPRHACPNRCLTRPGARCRHSDLGAGAFPAAPFRQYGQPYATSASVAAPIPDRSGSVGTRAGFNGRSCAGWRKRGSLRHGDVWVRGPNGMLGYWNIRATASLLQEGWLRTVTWAIWTGRFPVPAGRRGDMIRPARRVHPSDVEEAITNARHTESRSSARRRGPGQVIKASSRHDRPPARRGRIKALAAALAPYKSPVTSPSSTTPPPPGKVRRFTHGARTHLIHPIEPTSRYRSIGTARSAATAESPPAIHRVVVVALLASKPGELCAGRFARLDQSLFT